MSNPRKSGQKRFADRINRLRYVEWHRRVHQRELGDHPFSALVEDQQPVRGFRHKLVNDKTTEPRRFKNYFGVIKMSSPVPRT